MGNYMVKVGQLIGGKVKAEHDTPPYYPYMEENEHLEGQCWSPDHLACLPLSLILV